MECRFNWDSGDLPGAYKNFKIHSEFMFKGPPPAPQSQERGRDVFGTWTLTDKERKSLDTLYTKFETYVKPKSIVVFSRYKFQCKKQGEQETCEQFIIDLKVLAKDCAYTNADKMVREKIVFGTKHAKVREKLVNEGSDLTLEKAVDFAHTYEIEEN